MSQEEQKAEGRVARVVGPVVDVEFPPDSIPPLYNALKVDVDLAGQGEGEGSFTMTLEVAQHLGDNLVRTIALKPTAASATKIINIQVLTRRNVLMYSFFTKFINLTNLLTSPAAGQLDKDILQIALNSRDTQYFYLIKH